MGARRSVVVAAAALACSALPSVASAGDAPVAVPVATLGPTPALVGDELDAEMACEWADPEVEGETPIPTFEMVPPSGGIVAPDSTTGDAGTVFATWTATEAGEWALFVTCETDTLVWTAIVNAPTPTDPEPTTTVVTTAPDPTTEATLPSTGSETTVAMVGAALFGLGVLAVLVARRRLDA